MSAMEAIRIVERFPDALCLLCERRTEDMCCACQIRPRAVELIQSVRIERMLVEEAREAAMTDFDRFWKIYPKKEKKQEARKAWKKLDPAAELAETIIEEVKRRAESYDWKKEKHAFVPMASAYLNGRRWEDEWEDRSPHKARKGAKAAYAQTPLTEAEFEKMFVDLG